LTRMRGCRSPYKCGILGRTGRHISSATHDVTDPCVRKPIQFVDCWQSGSSLSEHL